jgi:DNA-binding transcriptional ArsR family regulator
MDVSTDGEHGLTGYGTDDSGPGTVVRLEMDDLARVCFSAAPAPLVETVLGFAELRHLGRRPDLNSWVSQARQAFPAAARPLHDLIPASGPWPLFLDPAVADLEEGLAIVSATPRSQLRHELATTWHRAGHPPTWLKALADGDQEAMTIIVQALRAFYQACVAPNWPRIAASFQGDVAQRAAVLTQGGLDALFGSFHPDLSLRYGSLWRSARALARAGSSAEYRLEGRGLQILPSMLWTGPPLFSIFPSGPLANTMIYPARRDIRIGHAARADDLDAVIGRTRARVLRALREPCSTTGLADRVGISVSSASEHATALRGADLVRTERQGQGVRHSLTSLGRALLSDARRPLRR